MHRSTVALTLTLLGTAVSAQNPLRHFTDALDLRFARSQPVIQYALTIGDRDTTGFAVELRIRNAPDTFRIAMAKHPEYDDRYFRFVRDLRIAESGASVARVDSAVWTVVAPRGIATISYRIELPAPAPPPRAAWRPVLSSTGGLTGGPHAFMYVVGAELAPAHVAVRVPSGWSIATGLTRTADPATFFAPTAYALVESPILVGRYSESRFSIDGVPHTIAYWSPAGGGTPFDTARFRGGVERMAGEAARLFGRPPYREYLFQFQDLAFGGLEHHNSVTLGTPSADLARNPYFGLQETAHEFIHTWNLMRIRPAQYVGVGYRQIQPVPTLWFSEGLTIFYADLLLRRAGLPTFDSTRLRHLESIIARYNAQPGSARFSAEQVSRVAYNARPDALGDYDASAHNVGEILGTMLDLVIRDASDGRRSMDDVMRLMLDRTDPVRGFTKADVERAVADVCRCDVRPFFDTYVRGARPMDFNRYLGLIGLRASVAWEPAARDGQPMPDTRIRVWNAPPDSALSLLLGNPRSVWGRAGLHAGDRLIAMNDSTPRTWPEFRRILGRARIGDTVRLVVQTPGAARRSVIVVMSGYDRPVVRIERIAGAVAKQITLRDAWERGLP
jgi:predicted metalloprotease with PDZ domain